MIYFRQSDRVCFLLPTAAVGMPTAAVGLDIDGRYFVEISWLNFSIGFGL